ncbi:hypothetical protein CsSME_00002111 [Camellia sinensis var. sinensis]
MSSNTSSQSTWPRLCLLRHQRNQALCVLVGTGIVWSRFLDSPKIQDVRTTNALVECHVSIGLGGVTNMADKRLLRMTETMFVVLRRV